MNITRLLPFLALSCTQSAPESPANPTPARAVPDTGVARAVPSELSLEQLDREVRRRAAGGPIRKDKLGTQLAELDAGALRAEFLKKQFAVYGIASIDGVDDRIETFEITDPARKRLAEGVAAIYPNDLLGKPNAAGIVELPKTSLMESHGVCPTERFSKQPTKAKCSAFLVKPNILASAGHCIETDADLEKVRFVFGHRMVSGTEHVRSVHRDDVYKGKRLLKRVFTESDADWEYIELDRASSRPVFTLNATDAALGAAVSLIGHPSGLPAKSAGGANVREADTSKAFFVANLDAFGGNSGSPVLNSDNKVVGILVRGAPDYIYDPDRGCRFAAVCPTTGCIGESSTKVSVFGPELPR